MLTGTYKYGEFLYDINAYDYGDNVVLFLSCPLTKGISFADKGMISEDGEIEMPPTWERLYASVGSGAISVEQYVYKDDKLTLKSQINEELFSMLGSIIRGMKAGCKPDMLAEDDNLFNISFNPMKLQKYVYDYDCDISLEMGIIKSINYVGEDGTELHIDEDGSYNEKIFPNVSTKKKISIDISVFVDEYNEEDSDWDFSEEAKLYSIDEIIERNPHKNYLWIKDRKYEVVKTTERMQQICKMIWQHDGIVAFDTETTGLNVTVKSREGAGDRLVGMVFCITPGEAYYFPVAHKKIPNICSPGNEQFIIEKYFKPILEQKDILAHNGAYDWKVMYNYGICLNLVHDTYILFKVTLWNDHTNLGLGLKNLTKVFLNRDSFELSDFVDGKFDSDRIKFWDFTEQSTKEYACPDTDNDLELFQYAMNEDLLGKYDARKIYEIEVLFSIVIAYQEYYGHCVDVSKIDDLIEAIRKDKTETYDRMIEYVGREFNPKSSKDMQNICFDILQLPIIDYTDAGNPSTGKGTRKAWLKSNLVSDEKKAFIKDLNTYLDARTLESNFTNNIDKFATSDGLMFSKVEQFLATGRVSTKDPNYQGYSDTVKKYIAPRTGYYAMDADYSSVEARIMCSMAGCSAMVEKMKDPDTDYHRQKASDMFGVPYELVTDQLRKMSKGVNFGILYGLGDPNLGANLYGVKSPENTKKAKKQKELYFKGMEELRGFIDVSRAQGTTNNFSTTYFNRRRYYDPRRERRDTIERQSCNARIQGTAADIYKLAMVRLFIELRNRGWLGKVLISGFVHDECYLEIHKSINPATMLAVLREAMMLEIEGWCPLFTGMGFGRNWYEAKHTEIPVQVQQMIVDKYSEKGFDWWDGNTEYLCQWTNDTINNYMKDRVIAYVRNKDNWGKVFKPTENELCHEVLKLIKKGTHVEGQIEDVGEVTITEDMIEDLREFCRIFNILEDFDKANILKPVHDAKQENDESTEEVEEYEEEDPMVVLKLRIDKMGVYSLIKDSGREIYFKYDESNSTLMNLVRKTIDKMPGDSPVFAIKDGEIFTTGLTVDPKVYPKLLQLFMSNRNIQSR